MKLIDIRPKEGLHIIHGEKEYALKDIARDDVDPKHKLEVINMMNVLFYNNLVSKSINNALASNCFLMN